MPPNDEPKVLPEVYEQGQTFSSTEPTFKYYQVAVPNHSFNQTGDQTGVTTAVANVPGDPVAGSSFLRMGSFPDVNQPGKGPAGFANSLQLANLVGDAKALIAAESPDVAPNTFNGDPNYLLGFNNDTRVVPTPLAPNQGQAETAILLTKGGWWDHSDGNRITTTAGDKIEIIQGNYKMVVIGRLGVANAAQGYSSDNSGGIEIEQGPSPDQNVKSVEWTQDEGGTWTLYENNGVGNVYSSFYGEFGEIFVGPRKESWTGQAPAAFPKSPFYNYSQGQRSQEGAATSGPDTVLCEYTWAASITTYTGSETKPIPTIEEFTFANSITTTDGTAAMPIGTITESAYFQTKTSTTNATTITETTTVTGDVTGTTTVSGAITDTTTAASTTDTTTVSGAITSMTTAAAITDVTMAAAITDVALVAAKTGVTLGAAITEVDIAALVAQVDIAAVKADVFLGALKADIALGFRFEFAAPEAWHCELPEKTETRIEKLEVVAGEILSTAARWGVQAMLGNIDCAMLYINSGGSEEEDADEGGGEVADDPFADMDVAALVAG